MSQPTVQQVNKALQEEELLWSNCNTIFEHDRGVMCPVKLRWVVGDPQHPLRAVTVALTAEQAQQIGETLIAHSQEARNGVILASPADIDPTARLFNGGGKPAP